MDEKLYTTKELKYTLYDELPDDDVDFKGELETYLRIEDLCGLVEGMDNAQAARRLSQLILYDYMDDYVRPLTFWLYDDESYLIKMTESLSSHLLSIAWEDPSYDDNDYNAEGALYGQVFIDSLYKWQREPDSHLPYFFIAINHLPVTEKSLMLLDRLPKGTELYSADDILARAAVPWKELRHSRMLRALTVELTTLVSMLLDMRATVSGVFRFVEWPDEQTLRSRRRRHISDSTRIARRLIHELLDESLSAAYDRSCICGPRFTAFHESPKFEVLLTNPERQEPYEVKLGYQFLSGAAGRTLHSLYRRLLPAINIYLLSGRKEDDIVDFLRRELMTEE